MVSGFRWLALETWFLEDAIDFYTDTLDRPVSRSDGVATVDVGAHTIQLREPGPVPRGGLHVHYALATTPPQYEAWYDRLAGDHEVWEHEFGDTRSVYVYDPDDHCVEIGDVDEGEEAITRVFEVALEVEALDRAIEFYEGLGFDVVDQGSDRRRVRLSGPIALELWEPQRGIAEARGGVHAHLGFSATNPRRVGEAVADQADTVEPVSSGIQVKDPDGHYLTISPE